MSLSGEDEVGPSGIAKQQEDLEPNRISEKITQQITTIPSEILNIIPIFNGDSHLLNLFIKKM